MKPNNNEPKFRASYSVISLWASGNWEMAVGQYFKLRKFTTEEMADGKDHHEQWCAETLKTDLRNSEFIRHGPYRIGRRC